MQEPMPENLESGQEQKELVELYKRAQLYGGGDAYAALLADCAKLGAGIRSKKGKVKNVVEKTEPDEEVEVLKRLNESIHDTNEVAVQAIFDTNNPEKTQGKEQKLITLGVRRIANELKTLHLATLLRQQKSMEALQVSVDEEATILRELGFEGDVSELFIPEPDFMNVKTIKKSIEKGKIVAELEGKSEEIEKVASEAWEVLKNALVAEYTRGEVDHENLPIMYTVTPPFDESSNEKSESFLGTDTYIQARLNAVGTHQIEITIQLGDKSEYSSATALRIFERIKREGLKTPPVFKKLCEALIDLQVGAVPAEIQTAIQESATEALTADLPKDEDTASLPQDLGSREFEKSDEVEVEPSLLPRDLETDENAGFAKPPDVTAPAQTETASSLMERELARVYCVVTTEEDPHNEITIYSPTRLISFMQHFNVKSMAIRVKQRQENEGGVLKLVTTELKPEEFHNGPDRMLEELNKIEKEIAVENAGEFESISQQTESELPTLELNKETTTPERHQPFCIAYKKDGQQFRADSPAELSNILKKHDDIQTVTLCISVPDSLKLEERFIDDPQTALMEFRKVFYAPEAETGTRMDFENDVRPRERTKSQPFTSAQTEKPSIKIEKENKTHCIVLDEQGRPNKFYDPDALGAYLKQHPNPRSITMYSIGEGITETEQTEQLSPDKFVIANSIFEATIRGVQNREAQVRRRRAMFSEKKPSESTPPGRLKEEDVFSGFNLPSSSSIEEMPESFPEKKPRTTPFDRKIDLIPPKSLPIEPRPEETGPTRSYIPIINKKETEREQRLQSAREKLGLKPKEKIRVPSQAVRFPSEERKSTPTPQQRPLTQEEQRRKNLESARKKLGLKPKTNS